MEQWGSISVILFSCSSSWHYSKHAVTQQTRMSTGDLLALYYDLGIQNLIRFETSRVYCPQRGRRNSVVTVGCRLLHISLLPPMLTASNTGTWLPVPSKVPLRICTDGYQELATRDRQGLNLQTQMVTWASQLVGSLPIPIFPFLIGLEEWSPDIRFLLPPHQAQHCRTTLSWLADPQFMICCEMSEEIRQCTLPVLLAVQGPE